MRKRFFFKINVALFIQGVFIIYIIASGASSWDPSKSEIYTNMGLFYSTNGCMNDYLLSKINLYVTVRIQLWDSRRNLTGFSFLKFLLHFSTFYDQKVHSDTVNYFPELALYFTGHVTLVLKKPPTPWIQFWLLAHCVCCEKQFFMNRKRMKR